MSHGLVNESPLDASAWLAYVQVLFWSGCALSLAANVPPDHLGSAHVLLMHDTVFTTSMISLSCQVPHMVIDCPTKR